MYNYHMDLETYQTLSGITVPSDDTTFITALIIRLGVTLESLLGFTLDVTKANTNEYAEIGRTATDCPCISSIDLDSLLAPDAVVYAYRMYNFNKKDKLLAIDPASSVHKVKLVHDGITLITLDDEDYRLVYKNGFIKYIELCDSCFTTCLDCCECVQLAVDATWLWDDEDDIPNDLNYIWSDMITYYGDDKVGIKKEILGPHHYEKFDTSSPESLKENTAVLKKYAGPNGSLSRIYTA